MGKVGFMEGFEWKWSWVEGGERRERGGFRGGRERVEGEHCCNCEQGLGEWRREKEAENWRNSKMELGGNIIDGEEWCLVSFFLMREKQSKHKSSSNSLSHSHSSKISS